MASLKAGEPCRLRGYCVTAPWLTRCPLLFATPQPETDTASFSWGDSLMVNTLSSQLQLLFKPCTKFQNSKMSFFCWCCNSSLQFLLRVDPSVFLPTNSSTVNLNTLSWWWTPIVMTLLQVSVFGRVTRFRGSEVYQVHQDQVGKGRSWRCRFGIIALGGMTRRRRGFIKRFLCSGWQENKWIHCAADDYWGIRRNQI